MLLAYTPEEVRQALADEYGEYRYEPCLFAKKVLGVTWTPKQEEIARSLLVPPYRTLVKSAHTVGKTHLAAGLALWWFLTRRPAIVLSTAPKLEQVRDLLWKEIRRQAGRLVTFSGPRIPRVDRAADDFMLGTTASDSVRFQGHHGPHLFFLLDEAVGVPGDIWEVIETMFQPPDHAWLCIFNPTDSTSYAYQAEHAVGPDGKPLWHVITMSALDHPNIALERKGDPPMVPSAIRLGRLTDLLTEWCDPVAGAPDLATDIEWPAHSGKYLHPGPLAEARLLGRWPSQACGVWSDALWRFALQPLPLPPLGVVPELGCDVARFGDDWTVIVVRCGPCALHAEGHNGWSTSQTAGRLKELARYFAAWINDRRDPKARQVLPEEIACKIDDDGVGAGVIDQAGGYAFVPISGAQAAADPEGYPNTRSELWFGAADQARRGLVTVARLPAEAQSRLRQELMSPTYKLDAMGRRVVEPKADTKEKLGRSPDWADAFNLAWSERGVFVRPAVIANPVPSTAPREESRAKRKGLFGSR